METVFIDSSFVFELFVYPVFGLISFGYFSKLGEVNSAEKANDDSYRNVSLMASIIQFGKVICLGLIRIIFLQLRSNFLGINHQEIRSCVKSPSWV